MSRVLVVGLDGATFDIVGPLAAAGRLPNLAAMMRAGSRGTLRSTVPPVSPTAWSSFITGKNPGKHGVYGFQDLDTKTGTFSTVRTDRHAEKTLWQIVGEAGLPSLVWDVPFTYPPRPMRGWMLTGYGTPRVPGCSFTYPSDLRESVPRELRDEVRVALPQVRFERSLRFVEEWRAIMEGRRRLLRWLIRERPWSLFFLVFSITDTMAHVFWTYADPAHPNYARPEGETFREALFEAYVMCDRILGELVEAAGRQAVTIVLSDHGFGSVRPRQYIFERLMQGGWARPKRRGGLARLAANSYLRFPILREWVKGLAPSTLRSVRRGARRAGLIPHEAINVERSRIIPSSFGLQLWVNDRSRFRHGCVPEEEIESTLESLSTFLLADRDPVSGRPIVARVHRGAEIYRGGSAARGPDLVIEYTNQFEAGARPAGDNPYTEGGHTVDGILVAAGDPIRPSELEGADLIDVTPTVLHLLGQPVPPDIDGRVMEGILTNAYREAHPVRTGSEPARNEPAAPGAGYTAEQEKELLEQLRRLGYLE